VWNIHRSPDNYGSLIRQISLYLDQGDYVFNPPGLPTALASLHKNINAQNNLFINLFSLKIAIKLRTRLVYYSKNDSVAVMEESEPGNRSLPI
jgi:hypothetical protein